LITKLSRKSRLKGQDPPSRSKRPKGRIRRDHAPKRVANRARTAADPRQSQGIRGSLDRDESEILWWCLSGTPLHSAL